MAAARDLDTRRFAMLGLILLLGLVPQPMLLKASVIEWNAPTVSVAPGSLLLRVDLAAAGAWGDLGRTLGQGIAAGEWRVGLEGVPGLPFLSNFLDAHEVRFTRVDPEALASNLLVQLRVDLD